jgi:hypothetical protein
MRVGGSDGYGDVFVFTARRNKSGGATTIAVTPKLTGGEAMVAVFPGEVLRIKGAGASLFAKGVGGYPGKSADGAVMFVPRLKPGTLFVTSRRIVFLRRRNDWKMGFMAFIRGLKEMDAPDGAPSEALACGGIEYCEIALEDIKRLDRDLLGGRLRLETRGREYVVRLTRKQSEMISGLVGVKGSVQVQRPLA